MSEYYLISSYEDPFIVTRYLTGNETEEFYVHAQQVLGPVQFQGDNDKDWVFTLGDSHAIYVVRKEEALCVTDTILANINLDNENEDYL